MHTLFCLLRKRLLRGKTPVLFEERRTFDPSDPYSDATRIATGAGNTDTSYTSYMAILVPVFFFTLKNKRCLCQTSYLALCCFVSRQNLSGNPDLVLWSSNACLVCAEILPFPTNRTFSPFVTSSCVKNSLVYLFELTQEKICISRGNTTIKLTATVIHKVKVSAKFTIN